MDHGKSNIADSVRWVLGEQSNKVLRSSKMEDVIFAGTENRKKVGFAEVSLYIDNTSGDLPTDYTEVVITRRVFRSGESSYLINNNECRLKDIEELFLDTGLGKDGYSIVGQGKIDEILSSKSEDRRAIFEEASGIMKYRVKKEEATKKLLNAKLNIDRVNDILIEIESNIGPLEEKSNKAKEYLKLKENLKSLEVKMFLDSIKDNSQKLGDIDISVESLKRDIELENLDTENLEKAKINLKNRLDEVYNKIEESQKKYFETENLKEKLNSKLSIAENNKLTNNENLLKIDEDIKLNNEKITEFENEINEKEIKKETLEKNKVKYENELKEKQEELDEISKLLNEKDNYINNIKSEVEVKEDKINENNINISSYNATILANEKQIEKINNNSLNYATDKDRLNLRKQDLLMSKNDIDKKLSDVSLKLSNLNEKRNLKKNELDKLLEKQSKFKEELLSLKSKHNYLINLKNENEGYFKSVKSILDFSKDDSNVYGSVASLISTDEKYEKAISIALGSFVQNIVVEDEDIAKSLINYLKENNLGRATFLPLNSIKKCNNDDLRKLSKFNGFIGSAVSLCNVNKKFLNVLNLALNRCVIVDNIDNANYMYLKNKGNVKIITLSGEIIAPNGSITGGNTEVKFNNLLGRDDKIKKLASLINDKEKENIKLDDEFESLNNDIASIDSDIVNVKSEFDELNILNATNNEKIVNTEHELNKFLLDLNKVSLEKDSLIKNNEELKNEIKNLETLNNEYNNIIDKNNIEIEEYNRMNKEKSEKMDFLNDDIVNLKISLSSFEESSLSMEEIKERLKNDILNLKNLNISKVSEKDKINDMNKYLDEQILSINNEKNELSNFKNDYENLEIELKNNKEDINNKLVVLEEEIIASMDKVSRLKEEISRFENKKIKFNLDIENLKNDIWNDYELTINSSLEYLKKYDDNYFENRNISKEANNIRKSIKDLGDVDVSSIEEFKNLKERFDFLTNQKNDLDETKAKLENLINNVTSIMKNEFTKQFNLINEEFRKTFSELFGGGRACVKLTDESNVLESGIEIEAQPPGKKLQSLTLLSGGERALTATALLFAIIKIKAPPFCILDEIEAALDDVNVVRFAEYIKNYSNETQFIVITHRKGTMEVASTVYGVTMEEYGISKIISMKMRKDEENIIDVVKV